jgi:prephenate dehydrogenase
MHRLLRRFLGMGPSPTEASNAAGRRWVELIAEGYRDPRPLTPEEMDHLMAYTGGVAHRAFSALYDDED